MLFGSLYASSPQYKPIALAFFNSNLLAGILGIFPEAKPTITNLPFHLRDLLSLKHIVLQSYQSQHLFLLY